MKLLLRLFLLILMPVSAFSQNTISGQITDKQTGEPLPGAHIHISNSYKAVVSDADGSYRIENLKNKAYTLRATYVGYEPLIKEVTANQSLSLNMAMTPKTILEEEVIIRGTRAGANSPTTYQNMDKEAIDQVNMGQDLPYVMSLTPSAIASSDAGAGVGYTSLRIRGTDLTRINVTINGIPYNDPESQGVYWVNLPDFASSVDNIQIQRGVGTSTNGAAAFGASINIKTQNTQTNPYAEITSGAGSFNTFRNTVKAGTGLINGKWAVDTRLSKISSDGFVDRAESDLKSFFVSGTYFGEKSIVKANIFSGKERTYQSWYGVPLERLNNDIEGMQRYADHWLMTQEEVDHMMASDNRTYNYYTYDNEVDDYQQDHYQLTYSQEIGTNLLFNSALHYTHGEGYFEQMKKGESFEDYGLENLMVEGIEIAYTDLVRRKWLDNDFYGLTYSLNYKENKIDFTFGGAYNVYDGDHFGEIIWAQYASGFEKDFQYYLNTGTKKDLNFYAKANYQINDIFSAYGDLQYRNINYKIEGTHDDLRDLTQEHDFDFVNPKVGIHAKFDDHHKAYLSMAISNREPSRGNFRDADEGETPTSEMLTDYELGYTFHTSKAMIAANVYYMDYTDQLVLTGEINNVGDAIMTNVDDSYRAGIEIIAGIKLLPSLSWDANLTLSQNKIKDFTSYVDNWDEGGQVSEYLGTTDIAFSPNVISGSRIGWNPTDNLQMSLISKYVGKQYIDNTGSDDRKIDAYFVNDIMISYKVKTDFVKSLEFTLQVNNVFNEEYESNAWVYRYYLGQEYYKMTGYYPQAGTNFMAGVKISL